MVGAIRARHLRVQPLRDKARNWWTEAEREVLVFKRNDQAKVSAEVHVSATADGRPGRRSVNM